MSEQSRERFAEVVRAPELRLDLACLLLAAETLPPDRAEPPALDAYLDAGLAALDALADRVPPSGRDDVRLRTALAGFRGSPEDYARLESSLLPEVLRRRRGLPILLATVWTEVARRAGIEAYGVALPGHFVAAVGDPRTWRPDAVDGSRVLVDPFDGGTLLPYDRARDRVEAARIAFRREYLAPADPLVTVSRMLANIRSWATPTARAVTRLWATELAMLLPRPEVSLRRERALALLHLGRGTQAADAFAEYADLIESVSPTEAETARLMIARARAAMN